MRGTLASRGIFIETPRAVGKKQVYSCKSSLKRYAAFMVRGLCSRWRSLPAPRSTVSSPAIGYQNWYEEMCELILMPWDAVRISEEEYMRVRSFILAQQGNASSPPIPIGAAALGGISDGATADKSEKQQEEMDSRATTIHFLSPASQEEVVEEEKWDSNAMHAVEVGSTEIPADGSPQ